MAKKESPKQQSFESRMRRLEEIVESLENGDKPLEDVVTMFEEGIRLSTDCLEYLGKAELRLKKLSRDAAGTFHLTSEEDEG